MSNSKAQWSCRVVGGGDEGDWRTVFEVPPQGFTLARVDSDDPEGKAHCQNIRDSFVQALERVGLRRTVVVPSAGFESAALAPYVDASGGKFIDHKMTSECCTPALGAGFAGAAQGRFVRERGLACWCWGCNPTADWFVVCPQCGNKRCPKANHHDNACTNSNDPGQKGSAYE